MPSSESLKIIISLQDQASRGLRALNTSLGVASKGISGLSKAVFSLQGAIAGIGVGVLSKSFINAADSAEQYRTRLNVLLGSAKEGNRLFKEMAQFATGVSASYDDIMASATNLSGVMSGGVDEIKKWMPLISDLSVAAGLTIQDTTNQIIRMYSAGAGAADLFRDRGTLAMLGFQSGVHYSAKKTREMLIQAFEDPASKFKGASVEMAKTWTGMLGMLGDKWFQFRNAVMDSGLFEYMKAALSLLLGYVDDLKGDNTLDDWATRSSKAIISAIKNVADALGWVGEAIRGIGMIWKVITSGAALMSKGVLYTVRNILNAIDSLYAGIKKGFQLMKALGDPFAGKAISSIDRWRAGIKGNMEAVNGYISTMTRTARKGWRDLNALVDQTPIPERIEAILKRIDAEVAKRKAEKEKLEKEEENSLDRLRKPPSGEGKGRKNKFTLAEQLQIEIDRFNEKAETLLASLDSKYAQSQLTIEKYFKARRKIAEETYKFELDRLQRIAAAIPEGKREEKEKALLDIYKLQENYKRELIQLEDEYTEAIKQRAEEEEEARKKQLEGQREAARILGTAGARARAAGRDPNDFAFQQEQETQNMLAQQREEQEQLAELIKEGYAQQQDMQRLHHKQMLEQERLAAKQREEVQKQYVIAIQGIFGDLSSAFYGFYQASDRQNKQFFELYKAAAIAETIIATYSAAQKAYESLAAFPPLAVTAAAAAVAAGLARVAVIRNQQMAYGGLVQDLSKGGKIPGHSPHDRADNVPISATAGEFMQPVSSVKYYGVAAMEAIRRRLIPPSILAPFTEKGLASYQGRQLAYGGTVSGGAGSGSSYSVNIPVTTIDTWDNIAYRMRDEIERSVRRVLDEELG